MPRNSIRNLRSGAGNRPAESARSGSALTPGTTPSTSAALSPNLDDAPSLPPELQKLLNERTSLEQQMNRLVAGSTDDEPDPRFPVTSLGERRRQDDAWAGRRDRLGPSLDDRLGHRLPGSTTRNDGPADRFTDRLTDLAHRTGQRSLRPAGRGLADRWRVLGRGDGRSIPGSSTGPLGLPDLPNDPALHRHEPPLRRLPSAELRSLDDTLAGARRRLDILRGGSGDLDNLRKLAEGRLRARREENRADRDRDERRDRERHNNRTDRDDNARDQARLDRRLARS